MRVLTLIAAMTLFVFALSAAVASQETYRQLLGNDWLWGQGKWGATVDPKDGSVREYVVDDHARGRAFMIRTLLVGTTAMVGLSLVVTWIRSKPSIKTSKADNPPPANTLET
jgi:preprotein translocase subunit SecG